MYPIVSYSTIYSSSLDDILLYDLHIYISFPVPNNILTRSHFFTCTRLYPTSLQGDMLLYVLHSYTF